MARIPGIDQDVFPLNLGGNPFGWTADQVGSDRVLDSFVAGGGNFIDTADSYSQWVPGNSGGDSETILGQWLASRGNREQVVIATKVSAKQDRKGLGRDNVRQALAESLQRLRTDRIDLYYAHHDDESVGIADQVQTFAELVAGGSIRSYGLSNYTPARMREFFETAARMGAPAPAAIQPHYSLVHRGYEQAYAPIAAEFGPAIFPYYALASGFLTGKYRSAADAEGVQRGAAVAKYLDADGFALIDALTGVAQAHGSEPTTVALAWLLAKGVTAPIASVSRPDQLDALLAAPGLALTREDVATLDQASTPYL